MSYGHHREVLKTGITNSLRLWLESWSG